MTSPLDDGRPLVAVWPPPCLRVVIGSRCLTHPASAPWAKRAVWGWMKPAPPGTLFVSGRARGPDEWCALSAYHLRQPCLELRLDGRLWLDGRRVPWPMAKWSAATPPGPTSSHAEWKAWCFARDGAIADVANFAADSGLDVSVFALIAPWSKTQGTEYTLELFKHPRIAIDARLAPPETRPPPGEASGGGRPLPSPSRGE